jgi:hypothetical protein
VDDEGAECVPYREQSDDGGGDCQADGEPCPTGIEEHENGRT